MYVNYVDCGTVVARPNNVNTNAHDASGIFCDVYILSSCCMINVISLHIATHLPVFTS